MRFVLPARFRSTVMRSTTTVVVSAVIASGLVAVAAPPAAALVPIRSACKTTASWVVPEGVHSIDVAAFGSKGETGKPDPSSGAFGGQGGLGARVDERSVRVRPGQTVYSGYISSLLVFEEKSRHWLGDGTWVALNEPAQNCVSTDLDAIAIAGGGGSGSPAGLFTAGADGGDAGQPGQSGHGGDAFTGSGGSPGNDVVPGNGGRGGQDLTYGGLGGVVPTIGSAESGGTGRLFWNGTDQEGTGGFGGLPGGIGLSTHGGRGGAGLAGGGGGGEGGTDGWVTGFAATGGGGGGGSSWGRVTGLNSSDFGGASVTFLPDASVSFSATPSSARPDQAVTLTASVTTGTPPKKTAADRAVIGGGTVYFSDRFTSTSGVQFSRQLGQVSLRGDQSAETATLNLPAGSLERGVHDIRAYYGGYDGFSLDTDPTVYTPTVHTPAADASLQLNVKTAQTITWGPAPGPQTAHGPTWTPSATSSSGLPVSFSIDQASGSACTINNGIVSFIGRGECGVLADQAGNSGTDPAPRVRQAISVPTAVLRPQTITLNSDSGSIAGGQRRFSAQTSTGLPISFTSLTPEVCTAGPAIYAHDGWASFAEPLRQGTCTVAFDQPGTEDYSPAPRVVQSVEITVESQQVFIDVPVGVRRGDADVSLNQRSDHGAPVTVTSSTTDVCDTTASARVRPISAGTCTVTVTQAGNGGLLPASRTESFAVGKERQSVHLPLPTGRSFHVWDLVPIEATASSGLLPVSLAGSGACSVDDQGRLRLTSEGTCTVTATQNGDSQYEPAQQSASFGVTLIPQDVNIANLPNYIYPGNGVYPDVVTSAGLYGSIQPTTQEGVCTSSDGRSVLMIGTSPCTLTLVHDGTNMLQPASRSVTIQAGLQNQSIRITTALPSQGFQGDYYELTGTGGGSGNPVIFTAEGTCNTFTSLDSRSTYINLQNEGRCTVVADQAGNDSYAAAPQVVQSFDIWKRPSTVGFGGDAPTDAVMGGGFTPSIVRGYPNAVTVLGASGACSVPVTNLAIKTVRFDRAGTCRLTLDQVANSNYAEAPRAIRTFPVAGKPQQLTFTSATPSGVVGTAYAPTATGGPAPTPIRFGTTTPAVCTATENIVTLVGGGTCTVTADQAGDADRAAAPQITQSFAVTPPAGTVAFGGDAPTDAAVGESSTVTIIAGASSTAPVLTASGSCSVEGTLVRHDHAGLCTLTLNQAGDGAVGAAPEVLRSFLIAQGTQTLAFTSTAPTSAKPGGSYSPTVSGGGSSQPVALGTTTSLVCSVADGTVTFVAGGTCTVTANQDGDADWTVAPRATQDIVVTDLAPMMTVPATITVDAADVEGAVVTYDVTATDDVDGALTPACVPPSASTFPIGSTTVTCSVTDSGGHTARAGFDVVVNKLPQAITFTSEAPSTAAVRETYTPTATGGASGSPVLFAASGSCAIDAGVVTFTAAGTCTITATQDDSPRYDAAPSATQTVAVGTAVGSVSFGSAAPADARIGGSFTPTIVAGPSSAAPVLTASGACSVGENGDVSFTSAGICTLTLNQAGDATHAAATPAMQAFEVRKAQQSIAFTSSAPGAVVGGAGYTPTVRSGGSTAPVVLGTTTPTVCAVSGEVVSYRAPGSCVLTADQAGDATFESAPQVTQTVAVSAASTAKPTKKQTITFTAKMPASPEVGIDYPVAAKATSGLPVTLTATGGCTLTSTGVGTAIVQLTDATRCTIQATQVGDSTWRSTSGTQTLQLKAGTVADMTVKLTLTPRLAKTAPLTGKVTVKNVGTRDAATVTTRVTVTGLVASAPGAVQTPGITPGTTVLTWTEPRVAPSQVIVYPVTLAGRAASTTIDATVSSAHTDPSPANNTAKATVK